MLTLSKFSGPPGNSYGPRNINVANKRFTGSLVVKYGVQGLKLHGTIIVKLVFVFY